jgi:hypothetical protein
MKIQVELRTRKLPQNKKCPHLILRVRRMRRFAQQK